MKYIQKIGLVTALAIITAVPAQADTLASLERERSLLIAKQLEVSPNEGRCPRRCARRADY